MIRHRGGQRYVAVLCEEPLAGSTATPPILRDRATYLLVGALGQFGRTLCRQLACDYKPRLIFLSRRALDTEVEQFLAELRAAGAQTIYRCVDITDATQLGQVMSGLKADAGQIHGVFHLARSVADGPLQSIEVQSFRRTMAAKVEGLLAVDAATASEPLEFFVVYSAMAAFGIEGSAAYGYATAFQNAFVRDRNRRVEHGLCSGRSVAVCWGQCAADAHLSEQRRELLKRSGFGLIGEESVLPLLDAALRAAPDVVGVMAVGDRDHVAHLYGLIPTKAVRPTTLRELLAEFGADSDDRTGSFLRQRPYEELIRLYETLTT
jgi:NAD(P)-dependent dehydrogenase (short-subunit alcohol dehydrogenase family)